MATVFLYGTNQANVNFKFSGAKALFFGDSLAAGSGNDDVSYVDYISKMGVFGSVKKYAVYGSGFSTYNGVLPGNSLQDQVAAHGGEIAEADYIFIQYGNNDGGAIAYGAITLDTAKAAAKSAIESIYALNPTVTITMVVPYDDPLKVAASAAFDMLGSSKKIANYISEVFNVPVIGMLDHAGCNSVNASEFTVEDKIHFSDVGHRTIAELFVRRINVPSPAEYRHIMDYSATLYQNLTFITRYLDLGGRLLVKLNDGSRSFLLAGTTFSADSAVFSAVLTDTDFFPLAITLGMTAAGQLLRSHKLTASSTTL